MCPSGPPTGLKEAKGRGTGGGEKKRPYEPPRVVSLGATVRLSGTGADLGSSDVYACANGPSAGEPGAVCANGGTANGGCGDGSEPF